MNGAEEPTINNIYEIDNRENFEYALKKYESTEADRNDSYQPQSTKILVYKCMCGWGCRGWGKFVLSENLMESKILSLTWAEKNIF